MRRPSIRTALVFLLLAAILPLAVLIAVLLAVNVRLQEHAAEERVVGIARAHALAVERSLRAIEAALQGLARSSLLDGEDWDGFHRRAAEVGEMHGGWIAVTDLRNRQILTTAVEYGAALPTGAGMTAIDLVHETAEPMVTDLVVGAVSARPMIAVIVPVIRDGAVRLMLFMGLFSERIGALFTTPQLDPAPVALVFDRSGRVVVSVPDGGRTGVAAAPELLAAIRQKAEGWVRAGTFDEASHHFAFARVPHAGWTVALAIPARSAYGLATRSRYAILVGGVAALVLAALLALRFDRRIARPLTRLAAAATGGDGEVTVPRVDGTVAEVADLRAALEDAAEMRRRERAAEPRRADEERRRETAEQALAAVVASEERWRVLFEEPAKPSSSVTAPASAATPTPRPATCSASPATSWWGHRSCVCSPARSSRPSPSR